MKTEIAKCKICGQEFERCATASRRKQICDSERCQKIKKLGHDKPVTLDEYRTGSPTEYRADLDYHGKPYY